MSTVHTEYGPGRIIAQETVRGRTRFKVAGEGFEVWLDQTKLGGYEPPSEIDYDAPHWQGHHPDDATVYPEPHAPMSGDEYDEYADPRGHFDRDRMRTHPDYLDDSNEDAHYARRRQGGYAEDEMRGLSRGQYEGYSDEDDPGSEYRGLARDPGLAFDDDQDARYAKQRRQSGYAEDEVRGLSRGQYEGYDDEYNPGDEYRGLRGDPGLAFDDDQDARYARRGPLGKGEAHLAWAPMDNDNSTDLPYNPEPQHHAIGTPGDEDSSTIQPIHHIDADERLRSSDSISFDDADDDDEPGPNPDLFAKGAALSKEAIPSRGLIRGLIPEQFQPYIDKAHDQSKARVRDFVLDKTNDPEKAERAARGVDGAWDGASAAGTIAAGEYAVGRGIQNFDPGYHSGWGGMIHSSSRHEASPAALVGPALRVLGPMALNSLAEGGEPGVDGMLEATDPGDWGGIIHDASTRPAGLSDKYIDLTASVDYWNDPVAQFRHDPDAYINRIGHLMDEGLNPRFAEYMDLVEADSGIRTAAWKDVRAKAMRLKTSGAVHVKDIAPSRIMASVDGDHGTYDVTILKGASYGDQSIANWHCGCEWGKWAFKRKFTYVGRLCSHAYASYLTMQSAALKDQARGTRPSRGPSDMVIVKRKQKDRYLPTFQMAAGRRTADNLQNGPQRLTPDMVVNDTDDAHMFLDVTKDERDDVGPDDVMSDKDIVHFARLMRHCEVTEQPYPRQLVAFLARYAGCADDSDDDTQSDYEARDTAEADKYLDKIRSDADRKQEEDFGSMADRVHDIQDAVEEARAHGVDADRFVAMVRKVAEEEKVPAGQASGANSTTKSPGSGLLKSLGDTWNRVNQYGITGKPPENKASYDENGNYMPAPAKGTRSESTDSSGKKTVTETTPSNAADNIRADNEDDGRDSSSSLPADRAMNNPPMPGTPPGQRPVNNNPVQPVQQAPGSQQQTQTVSGPGGGAPQSGAPPVGAPAAGGSGKYTAPGGGQTSGNVADGGVAGAENGNNSAITKNMLDADGYYTVQKGDTLTDIAQRGYGDMNKYQDIAKNNTNITNVDDISEGTKIKLDGLNDVGNGGLAGNITNPAGGGADGDIATVDTPKGSDSGAETALNAGASMGTIGEVNTDTAAGNAAPATPPGGDAATTAVPPVEAPAAPAAAAPAAEVAPPPKPTAGDTAVGSLRTARDWLRWAAGDHSGDSATNSTAPTSEQSPTATTTSSPASGPGAAPGNRSAPATNPAQNTPGMPSKSETFDPASPAELEQQSTSTANPGAQAGGSNAGLALPGLSGGSAGGGMGGMDMGDIGGLISQGVGAASDIASGIGSAIPGIVQGIGSIFSSKQDFDSWVRYAYPAGGGDDFDPKTMPHIPFAGSGNPGPLEFGTSEEYADKARKKMDDVTDLGDGDLTQSMGDWQRQASYDDEPSDFELHLRQSEQDRMRHPMRAAEDEDDPHHREASVGYSTDDDSDIVRRFQAHLGDSALGAEAGRGSGRFDDIAGAAAGFLRTAGRNYSLAEQSELIREGDKGGARNLDSLDLKGTHYEDMNTLGW
jgi:LysM repeat protein